MDPRAVVGGSSPVQVEDLALIPALVVLPDIGQVEGGQAVRGVLRHPGRAPLIRVLHVGVITLVPDVDGNLVMLLRNNWESNAEDLVMMHSHSMASRPCMAHGTQAKQTKSVDTHNISLFHTHTHTQQSIACFPPSPQQRLSDPCTLNPQLVSYKRDSVTCVSLMDHLSDRYHYCCQTEQSGGQPCLCQVLRGLYIIVEQKNLEFVV